MSLINCPECFKEVSDKALTCIHCGNPLEDFKLKKVVIVDIGSNASSKKVASKVTNYLKEIFFNENEWTEKISNLLFCKPRKPIIIDNLDTAQANTIYDKLISLGATCKIYNNDDNNIEPPIIEDTGTPKCPTCHSTKIRKLGIIDKSVSVGLFGLASGKVGKTFQCDSCGYTW